MCLKSNEYEDLIILICFVHRILGSLRHVQHNPTVVILARYQKKEVDNQQATKTRAKGVESSIFGDDKDMREFSDELPNCSFTLRKLCTCL